jgi:hypothetical protein
LIEKTWYIKIEVRIDQRQLADENNRDIDQRPFCSPDAVYIIIGSSQPYDPEKHMKNNTLNSLVGNSGVIFFDQFVYHLLKYTKSDEGLMGH